MFRMKLHSILAASALAISSAAAFAQSSPAGIPADPNTNENVQPGPAAQNPSDPASGSNPTARVPTSPPGTGSSSASEGASMGESGSSSPAGIPADPNTDENVQPAPSNTNPADPATGNNPGARVPTAP
jgi:hypothetical protein